MAKKKAEGFSVRKKNYCKVFVLVRLRFPMSVLHCIVFLMHFFFLIQLTVVSAGHSDTLSSAAPLFAFILHRINHFSDDRLQKFSIQCNEKSQLRTELVKTRSQHTTCTTCYYWYLPCWSSKCAVCSHSVIILLLLPSRAFSSL